MDFRTGIGLTTDGDVLKHFRRKRSRPLERLTQQLSEITDVPTLLIARHVGFRPQALAHQVTWGAFPHGPEWLATETKVQKKPELETRIRCDNVDFWMRSGCIQRALETQMCIAIHYTKYLVKVFLPHHRMLHDTARVCHAAVDDLNLSPSPKVKRCLLQITLSRLTVLAEHQHFGLWFEA
jgi:hypothetical protein